MNLNLLVIAGSSQIFAQSQMHENCVGEIDDVKTCMPYSRDKTLGNYLL